MCTSPKRVPFPEFELIGPPCEHPGCKGVLVDHMTLSTKECFKKCSVCEQEFQRRPAAEMLAEATKTIYRAFDALVDGEP